MSAKAGPRAARAFDAVAGGYDAAFTDTALGQALRRRVWRHLAAAFPPGSRVLELACGTGVDACWLAQRDVEVLATDGSPAMIQLTAERARRAGLTDRVHTAELSWDVLPGWAARNGGSFAGILSNFGGLNTVDDWDAIGAAMGRVTASGSPIVLTVMGPFCPWEIAWHLARGRPSTAFRRRRGPTVAGVGGTAMTVWYPTPARLRRALAPWFEGFATHSLGLWLPPTDLNHLVQSRPRLLRWLNWLDRHMAPPGIGWGDHYVLVARRRAIGRARRVADEGAGR